MNIYDVEETFDGVELCFSVENEESIDREKELLHKAFALDDKDTLQKWFEYKIPSLALQRYCSLINFFQDQDNYWDLFFDTDDLKDQLNQSVFQSGNMNTYLSDALQLQLLSMVTKQVVTEPAFLNAMGNQMSIGSVYFGCKPLKDLDPDVQSLVNFIVSYMWTKKSLKKAAKVLLDSDAIFLIEECDSRALVDACESVYNVQKKYIYLLLNMMTHWGIATKARTLSEDWLAANPDYAVGSRRKKELSEIMFNHEVKTALF